MIKPRRFCLILLVVPFVFSCTSKKGERNFQDLKKVQQGMKMHQVHTVMENFAIATTNARGSDSLIVEEYESAVGASDHYKIVYTKTDSTVVEVLWGN